MCSIKTREQTKKRRCKILDNRECNKSRKGKENAQNNAAIGLGASCPDRRKGSRSRSSKTPAGTDLSLDKTNLEENYSERLLKKI